MRSKFVRTLPRAAVLALLLNGCATVAPKPMNDLTPLLNAHSNQFAAALSHPSQHRIQILISEVDASHGQPRLVRHAYRADAEYFYPASSIKLCAAVAALEEIERLQAENHCGDLLDVPLEIMPLFPGDAAQTNDATNLKSGHITVDHELRKLALVSGNEAFNRLFDVVGHERLNRDMHALGLRSVVINHRLSETRRIPNALASAEVRFLPPDHPPIVVPARASQLSLTNRSPDRLVGNAVMRDTGTIVNGPMDFTSRNGISLVDLQDLLIKIARPDIKLGTPPLKLSPQHRARLLEAMTEYPRESTNPRYPAKDFPDNYCKFMLPGIRRVFPSDQLGERIDYTAKIGRAYGFSVENAYLHNPRNGRAVFVSAVIYTNDDGILNDDKYEYETVADPFLENLGELVARHWLSDTRWKRDFIGGRRHS